MAKTKCWFGWVKRLFTSEAKTKTEKKSNWRWIFGRLEVLQQYPAQAALTASERTLSEVTQEQKKHAFTVAIATAAAAKAAVAAAHAAAEVVRLTSQSCHYFTKFDRNLAAIKIQSAYRAHLARKALRALKGLVRLQAIVRGRAVRRQAGTALKSLPSSRKGQGAEVWKRSIPTADERCNNDEKIQLGRPQRELEEKETRRECSSQRRWDRSIISKEDMEATWLKKQEATIKRERMKKYSFSVRESRNVQMLEDSVTKNEIGMLTVHSNPSSTSGVFGRSQVRLRHLRNEDSVEGLSPQFPLPRRSFSQAKLSSAQDHDSLTTCSPAFPTFMAVTASSKEKTRSLSTPKQRVGFRELQHSNHSFQHDNGNSFCSSYDAESISKKGMNGWGSLADMFKQ